MAFAVAVKNAQTGVRGPELFPGRVDPRVGSGRVGSGRVQNINKNGGSGRVQTLADRIGSKYPDPT